MTAIDLFSGAGGFTEGASRAGLNVVWAANHWPEAVDIHKQNHPDTQHVCQDLHQANWGRVPNHDVLLASPACQGHSNARGKERAHHDELRSTAWAVVGCAEIKKPKAILVENVVEFQRWTLYSVWITALGLLGYRMTPYVIDSADYGVAQNRKRLFLVGIQGQSTDNLSFKTVNNHLPFSTIMESAPFTSHYDNLRPATQERMDGGAAKFGSKFVMQYYTNKSYGRAIDRPLGTITTWDPMLR